MENALHPGYFVPHSLQIQRPVPPPPDSWRADAFEKSLAGRFFLEISSGLRSPSAPPSATWAEIRCSSTLQLTPLLTSWNLTFLSRCCSSAARARWHTLRPQLAPCIPVRHTPSGLTALRQRKWLRRKICAALSAVAGCSASLTPQEAKVTFRCRLNRPSGQKPHPLDGPNKATVLWSVFRLMQYKLHFLLPRSGPLLSGLSPPWPRHPLPRHLAPLLYLRDLHLVWHPCCRARASSSRCRLRAKMFRGNTLLLAPTRSMMEGAASQLRTGVARALQISLKVFGGFLGFVPVSPR